MPALLRKTANYNTTIDMTVQVSPTPDAFSGTCKIYIIPGNKAKREAKAGEVKVGFYHVRSDRPDDLLVEALTGNAMGVGLSEGTASLVYNSPLPKLPAEYKYQAQHVESEAKCEKHFFLDASGALISEVATKQEDGWKGKEMPADFSQRKHHSLFKR